MLHSNVTKTLKQIDKYFTSSDDPNEKVMYQFFKKEIKSKDIKIAHTDMSIIGRTKKTRKYVCGFWRVQNYHRTIPWIRIGISDDSTSPSLEIILPVFHGDVPELWSKSKNHFRLGIKHVIGKQGPTIQLFSNPMDIDDTVEIVDIITVFHRKLKAYGTIK